MVLGDSDPTREIFDRVRQAVPRTPIVTYSSELISESPFSHRTIHLVLPLRLARLEVSIREAAGQVGA